MTIVLDTNILWDKHVMSGLATLPDDVILPAVAFTERARQFRSRGIPITELWELLRSADVKVEAFTAEHGLRRAAEVVDESTWAKHSRDALIAGHVGPDDVLWTKNPKDFLKVGLAKEQIVGF